jgi:hypothetical protein
MPTKKPRTTTSKAKLKKPKAKLKAKLKSKPKAKLTRKNLTPKARAHSTQGEKKKKKAVALIPKAVAEKKPKKRPSAYARSEYARRAHVSFPTVEAKGIVEKAAKAVKLGLGPYVAGAAAKAAEEGWKPELKPRALEIAPDRKGAAKGNRHIFARFGTPELKEMVRKIAQSIPVSLGAYAAAAAIKAAKEGWKPELKPQVVEQADEARAS